MGRPRGRKHKLRVELQSVRDKSFENRLRHLVRAELSVCEAETVTVVAASVDYLRVARPLDRDPLDVCVAVPAGRDLRFKLAPNQVPCKSVVLSPCAEHDLDLWWERGVCAMQTARAVRLVEQADRAGCTLPLSQLVGLVHLGSRTVSRRLAALWKQGVRLPVVGIPDSMRGPHCRLSVVLRDHLDERPPEETRRQLLLSPGAYGRALRSCTWVVRRYSAGQSGEELAAAVGLSPAEVRSTLRVARDAEQSRPCRARLQSLLEAELGPYRAGSANTDAVTALQSRRGFEAYLIRRHCFSPARAELLAEAVERIARDREGLDRRGGDVVFWAISDQEPAGKARADCELVAAVLTFYDPQTDMVPRGSSTALKVSKAVRLATAARRQGGLLSLPDLSFLLGMEVSALQRAIARSGLLLPTRGTIMDIGRGVTHRVEILTLYVQGHTESQIVKRMRHSYEAVASYIQDFARVMLLVDRGLPAEHIRKLLSMSLKLVNEYIALYRRLDIDEHQWKLNLMRRAALAQEKKHRRSS